MSRIRKTYTSTEVVELLQQESEQSDIESDEEINETLKMEILLLMIVVKVKENLMLKIFLLKRKMELNGKR